MTFIWVSEADGESNWYQVDTREQIVYAKEKMREYARAFLLGQVARPVYVGDPEGDNHQNGQYLYADQWTGVAALEATAEDARTCARWLTGTIVGNDLYEAVRAAKRIEAALVKP